ncbi:nuclear transport factor 2 family protein [Flavobacterium hauense]
MKALILTAFMLCTIQGIKAQNLTTMETKRQDKKAIANAIEKYYFNGLYEGDIQLLDQIFYKGTLLFGDVKGVPYAKTLEQYLEGVKNRQTPKDSGRLFKGEIIKIKVVNSIAIAEVKVKMYEFEYHDMLSFHKIDGKWLIVNKMLTDVNP